MPLQKGIEYEQPVKKYDNAICVKVMKMVPAKSMTEQILRFCKSHTTMCGEELKWDFVL